MIIDAHAHVFPRVQGRVAAGSTLGLGYGRVAIGGDATHCAAIEQVLPPYNEHTLFTPEMLLANMKWAGVDRAMLLQGLYYGECNRYVLDALALFPDSFRGAAFCDPWETDGQRTLEIALAAGPFAAVKLECSTTTGFFGIHPEADLAAPELGWLWSLLERRGLALVLDLGAVGTRSYQTGAVAAIAGKHPDLKIVVAHLGQIRPQVEREPDLVRLWEAQIDLGRCPNVWFDCAALPAYLPEEDFPFSSAGNYLYRAIERIGPAKVLWGTDIPGLLTAADYPHLLKIARLHLSFLSPPEQEMVLGGNARTVFNF